MRVPLLERRRARPLLGTRVAIRAWGRDVALLDAALDDAFGAIENVHELMSFHRPASDVGRMNRDAFDAPVAVDARTWAVLRAAQAFSAESGGVFDITIAPRLEAAGLLPACPGSVDGAADWRDIELLDTRRVRFRRRLRIDLGGIAKGFAVDEAVSVLTRHGVRAGLVDAGGDMRAFGPKSVSIVLRHPAPGNPSPWRVRLQDAALASSAPGFSETTHGTLASALVDPRMPAMRDNAALLARPPMSGIAVKAPTAMTADALTKIALFAPAAVCEPILARHGAAALRLDVPC